MKMFCDLHTHSVFSDGSDAPEELIRIAEALGLGAVALTDHNSVSGLPRFLAAAESSAVTAVPGVEFTTGYGDREVHIVALFVKPEHFEAVEALAAKPHQWKEESNLALIRALGERGCELDYDAIRSATPDGRVNRVHFARALAEKGYVSTVDEAFEKLLHPDRGIYVPPRRLSSLETIGFIRSIGAVSVLAHPWLNLDEPELERFLTLALPAGLDAMEVYYSKFDESQSNLALEIAEKYGLAVSGGSDYHGVNKPGLSLGTGYGNLAVPMECCETLASLAEERKAGEE